VLDEALAFLEAQLIPNAQAEDAELYPKVEQVMQAPGSNRDHVEVVDLARELTRLRNSLTDRRRLTSGVRRNAPCTASTRLSAFLSRGGRSLGGAVSLSAVSVIPLITGVLYLISHGWMVALPRLTCGTQGAEEIQGVLPAGHHGNVRRSMDPVGGRTAPLSAHCGHVGVGGAWAHRALADQALT
jgi:hypothetical protein